MIPIPIGFHKTLTLSAEREDSIVCDRCRTAFSFVVVCVAAGHSFQGLLGDEREAESRARQRAEWRLKGEMATAVVAASCPNCGAIPLQLLPAWRRRQFTLFAAIPLGVAVVTGFLAIGLQATALLPFALSATAAGVVLGFVGVYLIPHDSRLRFWSALRPIRGYTLDERAAAITAAERARSRETQRLLGSPNPEDRWECPKCKVVNAVNLYRCSGCGLSLV